MYKDVYDMHICNVAVVDNTHYVLLFVDSESICENNENVKTLVDNLQCILYDV